MNSKFSGNGNIRKWPIGSSCLHFARNGSSNRTRSLFIEVALAGIDITKNVFFFSKFHDSLFHPGSHSRVFVIPFNLFSIIGLLVCLDYIFERFSILKRIDHLSGNFISMSKSSGDSRSLHRIETISPKQTTAIDLLINIQQRFDISRLNVFLALSDGENEKKKQTPINWVPNLRRNRYQESNVVCFCVYHWSPAHLAGENIFFFRCFTARYRDRVATTKQQTHSFTFPLVRIFVWHVRLV